MMRFFALVLMLGCALVQGVGASEGETGGASSLTKVSDLYPNDMGPAEIDVSSYPNELKQNYKVFKFKCAACHTIARPINSQFLELSQDEQKKEKAANPELFKDKKLAHVEDKIWNRYVKRMMTKPGCPVKGEDGKKIWEFLAYDSKVRKTGANAKSWIAHRKKLLADFKKSNHEAYEKLFGDEEDHKEGKHE
ncbi:MAG: hypothetical protein A2901_06980 [Elusimicrobia bacterium RIFCSPLOWO2_01_FULL_54_10]|nr:MAG: hypothetical protein A2901_06980 [Elusimicrobia bacterium RIFCSPLOWO2_01_FULL_54_10]